MTGWITEELDHKPELLESDGTPTGYIQRRDIKSIKDDEEKKGYYRCEMRFISVSEYEMLNAMQNIYSGGTEV